MNKILAVFRRSTFINLQLPHNTDESWQVQPGVTSTERERRPRLCQETQTGRGITAFLGISQTGALTSERWTCWNRNVVFFPRHSVGRETDAGDLWLLKKTRSIKLKVNEKTEVIVLVCGGAERVFFMLLRWIITLHIVAVLAARPAYEYTHKTWKSGGNAQQTNVSSGYNKQ